MQLLGTQLGSQGLSSLCPLQPLTLGHFNAPKDKHATGGFFRDTSVAQEEAMLGLAPDWILFTLMQVA